MKTIATILMLTGLSAATLADSQQVDAAYFHPAASLYIHGDSGAASNLVAKGLALHPGDGKLKALEELLKKQQEQKQEQEDQRKEKKEQEKKRQQDREKKEEKENQENQDEGQDEQQSAEQPQPPRAEQMSQDEAERLLDAMKQEEKNKRLQLQPVRGRPVRVEKDW